MEDPKLHKNTNKPMLVAIYWHQYGGLVFPLIQLGFHTKSSMGHNA